MVKQVVQPSILQFAPKAARYLRFSVTDARKARACLAALPADGLAAVVGLRPFPQPHGAKVPVPHTPGSLWCWLRGDGPGTMLHSNWVAWWMAIATAKGVILRVMSMARRTPKVPRPCASFW
jgi:hypothetical protein